MLQDNESDDYGNDTKQNELDQMEDDILVYETMTTEEIISKFENMDVSGSEDNNEKNYYHHLNLENESDADISENTDTDDGADLWEEINFPGTDPKI